MLRSTIIAQEVIIEAAFELVRKEGFEVLSARNIAKQIGCSTQPIYWCYKSMDEIKAEVCRKALPYLQNLMLRQFGIRKFPKKLVISLLFCNFIAENQ